jgi:hypothetical protein
VVALAGVLGLSCAAMLTLGWNQVRGGVIAGKRAGPVAAAPPPGRGEGEMSGAGRAG